MILRSGLIKTQFAYRTRAFSFGGIAKAAVVLSPKMNESHTEIAAFCTLVSEFAKEMDSV